MRGNRYAPVSLVVTTSGWISDAPLSVTDTPGRIAPGPSVALPKISPVLTWALAGPAASAARQTNTHIHELLIFHPPLGGVPSNVVQSRTAFVIGTEA